MQFKKTVSTISQSFCKVIKSFLLRFCLVLIEFPEGLQHLLMLFPERFHLVPGADPGILVTGGVKVAGPSTDQPISETYNSKSFFLQIRLLLDTLNLGF